MKKRAKFEKKKAQLSRPVLMIILGAIAAIFVAVVSLVATDSSKGVSAATNPMPTPVTQKRYKATRPIVVDRQTGQLRMPTTQETDEMVNNLATLASRPTEGLQQTATSSGGVAVNLGGGYGGVMLGRPNANGTWETQCVFTFDEGAEFLGITEDNSPQ